jgi:hypothetical protein
MHSHKILAGGMALAVGAMAAVALAGCSASTDATLAKVCAADAADAPIAIADLQTVGALTGNATLTTITTFDATVVHPILVKLCASVPAPAPAQ